MSHEGPDHMLTEFRKLQLKIWMEEKDDVQRLPFYIADSQYTDVKCKDDLCHAPCDWAVVGGGALIENYDYLEPFMEKRAGIKKQINLWFHKYCVRQFNHGFVTLESQVGEIARIEDKVLRLNSKLGTNCQIMVHPEGSAMWAMQNGVSVR